MAGRAGQGLLYRSGPCRARSGTNRGDDHGHAGLDSESLGNASGGGDRGGCGPGGQGVDGSSGEGGAGRGNANGGGDARDWGLPTAEHRHPNSDTPLPPPAYFVVYQALLDGCKLKVGDLKLLVPAPRNRNLTTGHA